MKTKRPDLTPAYKRTFDIFNMQPEPDIANGPVTLVTLGCGGGQPRRHIKYLCDNTMRDGKLVGSSNFRHVELGPCDGSCKGHFKMDDGHLKGTFMI